MASNNQVVGRRIHTHRVRLGMSPERFGIVIGVSGMTVRRVESGYQPFRATQAKFAEALQVNVDELWPLSLDHRKKRERVPA